MGVSLSKGGNVSLTKEAPGLAAVLVGLGWDARTTSGADFDLDASALIVDASGKILGDSYFVFFNNLHSPDGSVEHMGDNLTGEGEGDDGARFDQGANLAAVPAEVDKLVVAVSIYDAEARAGAVVRPGAQRLHPGPQPGRRRGDRPLRPLRGRVHRDGHDLRRDLPQRRGVEVPCGGPGLQLRSGRHRARISASTSADGQRRVPAAEADVLQTRG